MGWGRIFRYQKLRVVRLADSTHKIAAGLAFGVSVSFTPFVGTHFIQAGAAAYLTKSNMLASLIGTFVGNPATFPFMWYFAYAVGAAILSAFGVNVDSEMPQGDMSFHFVIEIIQTQFYEIFLPWLIGGYLVAALSWPISYFIFKWLVNGAKKARRLTLKKKKQKS